MEANGIAKWDGSAWSALGSGMNGYAYALAVSGTNLYAGGNFTSAGGVPANNIAKWDGSAWSALGSGMNGYVYALAVSGTNLYAGGNFTSAGGVPANNIAKWDGSAWSALGSGVNGIVRTLATDGAEHLFVGGEFSQAGTTVSAYIAQANLAAVSTNSRPAQTQTVTSCTDAALRSAIAGGGTVAFACNGTIPLNNSIVIGTNTVLDGSGRQVTISGRNVVRVFYVNTNASLTLINLTIANGLSADGFGGGIYNEGTLSATNCQFVANTVQGAPASPGQDGCGGGVYNLGQLNIIDCSFLQNSAVGGMGLGNSPGDNGGSARGGAICNLGVMAIERSLFASNTTSGGVGAMGCSGGFVYESTPPPGGIGATGGDARGGAFFVVGPSSLVNCTLTGNQATGGSGGEGGNGGYTVNLGTGQWMGGPGGPGGGGGTACGAVYDAAGELRLTNCTIAFNSSVGGSGGIGGSGSTSGSTGGGGASAGALQTTNGVMANCLMDGNSPANGTGNIGDAGHNLSSDASCTFTDVGSLNSTDAGLGLLADNGGLTLTMALLPGSLAIDAGDTALAPATDQRGFPRPAGLASDIGAFEYGSVMPSLAVSLSGATGLNILGSGNAGRSCRLLSSTDLSSWVPIATNCIGSDGTTLFHDNCAPGGACRFYLLVTP
jgi:hypothetical protein